MEKLKSYRIFEVEIKELRKFLNSTMYAFNKVGELKKFQKNIHHKEFLDDNGFNTKPSGICSFNKNSISSLEKTLNQQTLVRAISALEVFLVDAFRDIFIITKVPFKEQSKVHTFNQAQLLSLKSTSDLFNIIINKECRNLSSGGFTEIIKTYKKKLNIDLLHIPPGKQKMIEYHEIRHLIIHKLGRTDTHFRNKYNISNKVGISVDENYLKTCLKDINVFAERTNELVLNKINELSISSIQQSSFERKVKYNIQILQPELKLEFLNTDFEFWVNDEFEMLKNILVDKILLSENELDIIIAGSFRQVKAYYSHLKYAKKKQIINLKLVENVETPRDDVGQKKKLKRKGKLIHIDDETLELIRINLPEQPWEKGIHKKLAEKLGLSNKVVSVAIRILIEKEIFKQQVNGIIIVNEKHEA